MAELLLQEHGTKSAAAPPPPTPEQLQHEAEEAARELSRERRRSSIGGLALPSGSASDQQHQLNASINIGAAQVEFEAQGVKINSDGLFINGENVSEVHQDDLAVLSELGRGACSVVKKAQHVQTRELYAIKVFSLFDREKRAQLLKEVETLWSMQCPSLISFVGGYLKDGSIHVVLEYMDRGSLTEVIHDWRNLEYGEDLMAAITIQMLWGLGYLHFEHRLHRDIKPQNVLLNSKGEVKLSDFGIARELEGDMDMAQTMVGTIRYMSPERLAGTGYGVAADVWSIGVVLMEMAGRRLPFDSMVSQIDLHERLQRDLAVDDMVNLVPAHSPEFEEVLRGCLQPIPEERLTPSELLELEWFRPFRRPITLRQSHSSTEEEVEGGVGKVGAISPASSGKESGSMTSHSAATETTEVMSIDGDNHGEGHGNKYPEKGEGGKSEDKGDNVQGGKDKGVPRQREDGGSGCFDDDDDGDGDECGGEQHDLDKAANIVREYILRAVERGILPQAGAGGQLLPCSGSSHASGLGDIYGDDDEAGPVEMMIRTMNSDLSATESSASDTWGASKTLSGFAEIVKKRGDIHLDAFDSE